jgi:hypothetical protein
MKHRLLAATLALFLLSCGGDDGAGPGDDGNNGGTLPDPVPTAVGTPNGAPTTETIGAGGGSVASSDGAFTLNVPAGALAADTDITIQPVTNTAWGGIGASYQLTPDGLTFSQPVELVFDIAPEDLAGSVSEALDVAFQDDAGFWFIVKDGSYDSGSGTFSCTTTHFSSYTAIEEYKLTPVSAGVGPSSSVTLYIEKCFYETIAEDPTAIAQVLTCSGYDEELVALIDASNWSVNGVRGGNTSVGRVVELSGASARYTAPAAVPLANPVAVSVQVATRRGSATYLVSNINVTSGFAGTVTHETGSGAAGEKAVYTITWESEGAHGDIESFTGQGTIDYTPPTQPDCTLDFSPRQAAIANAYMIVNRAGNPLQVTVSISADWDVHECAQCLSDPPICQDYHFFAGFDDGQTGTLSSDGNTITGYYLDIGSGENWYYTFTRTAPAP